MQYGWSTICSRYKTSQKHHLPRLYYIVDVCRQIPAPIWGIPISESNKQLGCLRTFHTSCSCPGSFPGTPQKSTWVNCKQDELFWRPNALLGKGPMHQKDKCQVCTRGYSRGICQVTNSIVQLQNLSEQRALPHPKVRNHQSSNISSSQIPYTWESANHDFKRFSAFEPWLHHDASQMRQQ